MYHQRLQSLVFKQQSRPGTPGYTGLASKISSVTIYRWSKFWSLFSITSGSIKIDLGKNFEPCQRDLTFDIHLVDVEHVGRGDQVRHLLNNPTPLRSRTAIMVLKIKISYW